MTRNNFWSRYILLGYFIIYTILGITSLIKKELVAADGLIAAFFCLVFIFINKKYQVNAFTAFLAGFIFVPHLLGLEGLYELASLNYHFDWIVHILSAFCSTYVILDFLLRRKYFSEKFFSAAMIALSITIAFGTLIEVSEYWGFITIGFGEGYLGFGAGDNSQNFGPWENSSLDSSLNFFGGFFAILIYGLLELLKEFLYSKR